MADTIPDDVRALALYCAREVLAQKAEAENAHHTASLWRTGKWDQHSPMVEGVDIAAFAIMEDRAGHRRQQGEGA